MPGVGAAPTYATLNPSAENVGSVAPAPVPSWPTPAPSAFATEMPFTGSVKAICVPSSDQDGSLEVAGSALNVTPPEPSVAIVQTCVPHVYASLPLSPEKAPPDAADSGTSAPRTVARTIRLLGDRRCTRTLYRVVARLARGTVARGGTSRRRPCTCRFRAARGRGSGHARPLRSPPDRDTGRARAPRR